MNFETKTLNYFMGCIQIPLPKGCSEEYENLVNNLEKGKTLLVEIKVKRHRRSLNANAALWGLLGEMAKLLYTTAEELYIKALKDYGDSRFIAIVPEDLAKERMCHRIVEQRGYTYANGYKFMVLEVWDGSSTYDTKQFARLLDGVIIDAKEIGIDFISNDEKSLLLKEWGEMSEDDRLKR